MSIANLPNLFPAPFTSNNTAVIAVPVGTPLSVASKVLLIAAKGVGAGGAGGANALDVGTINDVSAYNAVTPAGFSLTQDSLSLVYKGGAADTCEYYVKIAQ